MPQRFLLGLDIGGGSGRCLLADLDSGAATSAQRSWRYRPDPDVPMSSEVDLDTGWPLLAEALAEALARAGASPEQVAGIGVSTMRHGSALIDADGRTLLAATNRDARGLGEILELAAECGELILRRTGHWPNSIHGLGRLRWMAKHAPERFARAAHHLSLSDWIAHRLCSAVGADPSQAGESLLLDVQTRDWAWDLIERFELPPAIFPPLREPGTRLGELTDGAARELGLRAGTPVAVGGADTQCGLLGAGVVEIDALGIIAGTSTPLQQVTAQPVVHPDGRLWTGHHVIPGRWILESNAGGVGEALVWLARLLFPDAPHPLVRLLGEAAESPPGAAGLFSSFAADVMDGRALRLPMGDLTLSHLGTADDPAPRRHLARAVFEGVACGLRANLEQIRELAPAGGPLRMAGGLSRSAWFTQLVSDVFEAPVEVAQTAEATALGAAICAGVGAGEFASAAEGAARLVHLARRHEPDAQRSEAYRTQYAAWREARRSRLDSDPATTGFMMQGLARAQSAAAAAAAPAFRPRIRVGAAMDEDGLAALREIGDVEYASWRDGHGQLKGDSLVEALRGVHVFVTEIDVVDAAALLRAPDLRVLAVCRGNPVNADIDACTALGIPVLNAPGRNADAVADLALAFMLMLARKLPEAIRFLREREGPAGDAKRMGAAYRKLRGRELWQKTVGFVGFGAVGRKLLERLLPAGSRCLVHDPYLDPDAVRAAGAEPVSLDELLQRSDFVTLHAAVTEASRGMIGARELALMRPGSCLVNTARAALVDDAALREALGSGHLGGAALDVFPVEPPASDDPLLALPNVIATPHIGGNTAEIAVHQARLVAADLDRLRRGERPRGLVNPEVLPGFRWSEPRPPPSPEAVERLGKGPAPAATDLEQAARPAGPRAPS